MTQDGVDGDERWETHGRVLPENSSSEQHEDLPAVKAKKPKSPARA